MENLCSKTVIYATHQLEFLDASDLILVCYELKITLTYNSYNESLLTF